MDKVYTFKAYAGEFRRDRSYAWFWRSDDTRKWQAVDSESDIVLMLEYERNRRAREAVRLLLDDPTTGL